MSKADRIETWLRTEAEPDVTSTGPGRCVVVAGGSVQEMHGRRRTWSSVDMPQPGSTA